MAKSVLAFTVIKWVGVLYLVYLAVRQWRATTEDVSAQVVVDADNRTGRLALLVRGALVNITNPKGLVFLLAVLPQFVALGRPLLPQYLTIAATMVVVDVVVMCAYPAWPPGCWAGCAHPPADDPQPDHVRAVRSGSTGALAGSPWCTRLTRISAVGSHRGRSDDFDFSGGTVLVIRGWRRHRLGGGRTLRRGRRDGCRRGAKGGRSAAGSCGADRRGGRSAHSVAIDVTDERSVRDAVAAAAEHSGRIDAMANLAGYSGHRLDRRDRTGGLGTRPSR